MQRSHWKTWSGIEKGMHVTHYHLRPFAIMVSEVRPGSFIVTWVVPISLIRKLKANIPRDLSKQYDIIKLEIGGSCVYDVYSEVCLSDLPLDAATLEKRKTLSSSASLLLDAMELESLLSSILYFTRKVESMYH